MSLMRVRLELAPTLDVPEGSAEHGYEFLAPLDEEGHIDPAGWKNWKDSCEVIRFRGGETPQRGRLRHVRKGWRFDYDARDNADDEAFFRFGHHSLLTGNYVSITEQDGVRRTYRVVSATPPVRDVPTPP